MLTVLVTSVALWSGEGGRAMAAMKLKAKGAAKRHISSALASSEYGAVCL